MSLSLREEVKLNQTENAWVPTAAKKATKSEVVKTKNEEEQKNDVGIKIEIEILIYLQTMYVIRLFNDIDIGIGKLDIKNCNISCYIEYIAIKINF